MKYKIYSDRVKLIDSFAIPKAKYARELQSIRNLHPNIALWNRSEGNIRREWASHNLAYSLGVNRAKTSDCDLNYEPKWYENLAYGVVGTIALWLVR